MKIIELHNLTKHYGKSRGIENVSFSIEEGEIFGFIGPNGAGKSTTIRTLLGLIKPTDGYATIFGKDCTQFASEIANEVGYLPSEVFYYENMKVKDLLKYAASFYKKDCQKRVDELVEYLELDVNKKIEDLSLGNKKKVGIVQGLLHEPKLIILDEPTSGLDPLMQQKFFDLLVEENKKGATILFSSHILSEVQKLCQRVAIIKEGTLIGVESIKTLREDNYKNVKISLKKEGELKVAIAGMTNYNQTGKEVSFLYRGNMNELLAILVETEMDNLWIEEPTLEEIFMHYYESEA